MFMGSNSSGGVSTGRTPPRLCWIVVCGEITSLLPLLLLLVTPPPLCLALSSLSSIVARAITSNRETPQAKTIPFRDETARVMRSQMSRFAKTLPQRRRSVCSLDFPTWNSQLAGRDELDRTIVMPQEDCGAGESPRANPTANLIVS